MRRGVISEIVCVPGCKTPWKYNKFTINIKRGKKEKVKEKREKLEEYDAIKGANTEFYYLLI